MKNSSKPIVFLSLIAFLASCRPAETTQPQKRSIINAVFSSGYIIHDNEYQVTANTEGYLVKRFVDEGTLVRTDMPMFQLANEVQAENLSSAEVNYQDALRKLDINSPERAQLELQISQSKTQLAMEKSNFERYERLVAKKAVSQVDYEKSKYQYESALNNVQLKEKALADFISSLEVYVKNARSQVMIQKSNTEDYLLNSNIDGIVLKVYKRQGELVRRGEALALVGGGQKLARLFVAEEDIEKVAINQNVYLNLNTQKNQNFEGTIRKIYPSFDELEQSFIVEASFNYSSEKIYHHTQLQANIIITKIDEAWVIPSHFIVDGDSVIIKGKGKKFVQFGIRNELWTQVVSGLDENQTLLKLEKQ